MTSSGGFPTGEPANANALPKIMSIFDFSADALGQLRTWLEQNPPALPLAQMIGYQANTQSARLHKSAQQTIANLTSTAVVWDVTEFDYGGMFPSGSTTKLKVQLAGKYIFGAGVIFTANSTGNRYAFMELNGTTVVSSVAVSAAVSPYTTNVSMSTVLNLSVGDYVEVYANQNSGGNLNVDNQLDTHFWAVRVGP